MKMSTEKEGSSKRQKTLVGDVMDGFKDDNQEATGGSDKNVTALVPADIIPGDVWKDILDMLDYSDMLSCFQTCPGWRNLLAHKRTLLLFPEVFKLLVDTLPKEELLKCREACRKWKQDADQVYQSHQSHVQLHFEKKNLTEKVPELINGFHSSASVQRFLQETESHSGNPFPGRRLNLLGFFLDFFGGLGVEEMLRLFLEYWSGVIQLLVRFGSHVHFAQLDFDDAGQRFEEVAAAMLHTILRNCLMHLPNLKTLTIRGIGQTQGRNYNRLYPLPRLEHLETLVIVEAPASMTTALLYSCVTQSIKRFDIRETGRIFEAVYGFRNLEVLRATVTLNELGRFRTPLRKLDLLVDSAKVDFRRLFMSLENFGEMLEHVAVEIRGVFTNVNGLSRTSLPKLEILELSSVPGIEKLDFFQDNGGSMSGHQQKKTIWMAIPSLKEVVVGGPLGRCCCFRRRR